MDGEHESYCPHCGADLRYVVGGIEYNRATSVEIRGVYDGGLFYAHIGGCERAWHRWPENHHLRARAQSYLDDWNQRVREREREARNREVTEAEDA